MKYEAYMARGYGYGMKKDVLGIIGQFETEQEAAQAAMEFTAKSLPNNHPDCYDIGQVRQISQPH